MRPAQGLYDPQFEHDACGIGAVVDIAGTKSHKIVDYGKQILLNLQHRGAVGGRRIDGRRGGNPHANPARVLRRRGRSPEVRIARPRDITAQASFSCPATLPSAARAKRCWPRPGKRRSGGAGMAGRARQPHLGEILGIRPSSARSLSTATACAASTGRRLSAPQAGRAKGAGRLGHHAGRLLHSLAFLQDHVYKGMFLAPELFDYYPTWPTTT